MKKSEKITLVIKDFKYTQWRSQYNGDGKLVARKVIKWDKNGNLKSINWKNCR